MRGVASDGQERCYWLIEPLLAAGMGLDEIRALVVRLALDSGVGTTRLVADHSREVQAAWAQMIGRMLAPES